MAGDEARRTAGHGGWQGTADADGGWRGTADADGGWRQASIRPAGKWYNGAASRHRGRAARQPLGVGLDPQRSNVGEAPAADHW